MAYHRDIPAVYRNNYIERNPVRIYKDIDMSFGKHPISGDIIKKTNEEAIKQALVNLVMLNFYEKPFHPEIGGDIYKMLFENINSREITFRIQRTIDSLVRKHEPRVELDVVRVEPDFDNNAILIDIHFKIINTLLPSSVEIFLDIAR